MPREKKKRGRRAEKTPSKRKREDEEVSDSPKRQRTTNEDNGAQAGDDYIPLDTLDTEREQEQGQEDDTPFYGLLDTDEQEYFSKASQTLELNSFEDDDDKRLFIESVYTEAKGKELKIACSQSCSRLMEKLIAMSTPAQVKDLFEKFTGHFLHLVQHRFASHCCECLFIRAAPIVTSEMEKPKDKKKDRKHATETNGEDAEQDEPMNQKSAMDLFLGVVSELEGNWGYLLTESFASHTIRVLLLILAGEPLADQSNARVLASRKKENIDSITSTAQTELTIQESRQVPAEFNNTLRKMISDLSAGLNSTYLQALATHPIGSPVLQVILSIELGCMGKEKVKDKSSVFRRLIPDDTLEKKEEGVNFLNSLFYDPVGSRLLETIVRVAPGKFFKTFYKTIIRERIGSLARNEISSYVVIKVLERVSREDLQSAIESILPEIPSLVQRSRLNVIKTIIDRSTVRGSDTTSLAKALESAYGEDGLVRLKTILGVETTDKDAESVKPKAAPSAQHLHGSLLAQSMLQASGRLATMIQTSFLAAPVETLIQIARSSTASRALQEALKPSKSNAQFRRQFLPRFYGQMCDLSLDSSGSHVADALWDATSDLVFIKQRLAQELADNEPTLRDSFLGRAVWRNWSMDLYKRKRGEWMSRAKGLDNARVSASTADSSAEPAKSKLDLARARYAARAEQQEKPKPDSREQGPRGKKKQALSAPSGLLKAQ
ncbi:Nucleolar protein 9 [Trichophyton interdigitale]|nr:Nucleolar protein 9 [Trichophyton interdigitale]KAG5218645.1 Nucleolar protein 9 [Trichophyton interdigitale]KAG8206404.1 Nucleolar protein 9 [Trichophyton interdigitale]